MFKTILLIVSVIVLGVGIYFLGQAIMGKSIAPASIANESPPAQEPLQEISATQKSFSVAFEQVPQSGEANKPISLSWRVESSEAMEINHTAIHFGYQSVFDPKLPGDYKGGASEIKAGQIPSSFSSEIMPTSAGTLFLRAHALIDGKHFWSDEAAMTINEAPVAEQSPEVPAEQPAPEGGASGQEMNQPAAEGVTSSGENPEGGEPQQPPAEQPQQPPAEQQIIQKPPKEFIIEGTEFKFSPQNIFVKAGDQVKITFRNVGQAPHSYTIEGLAIDTGTIFTGDEKVLEFQTPAEPQTINVSCSVGNHKAQGMVGSIVVE
ncbi:MAG: cupredoxin domain-containing protein [Parcubacteria group bacterium]|nr:cupredoxin domain-containing protein [Parcubacteria group bacterium]